MELIIIKIFIKQVLIFSLTLNIVLLAFPTIALAVDTPSSWATDRVNEAIAENLVPFNLQSNYLQAITRAEFCALAVALYEALKGEITGRTTFTDTNDVNVEKAAYIGVVSGVGDNKFDPDGILNREQAAVMLTRLANSIGIPLSRRPLEFFNDISEISPWAVESIESIVNAGIMSGFGDGIFAPLHPYTREQSIVTIMQLRSFIKHFELVVPHPYEIGRVTLISNGVEYEPSVHFGGGVMYSYGNLISASGIMIETFFANNLSLMPEIQYTANIQIVVDGRYGQIADYRPHNIEYHNGLRLVGLFSENFSDGVANVLLPDEPGTYLIYIDITWRGDGIEHSSHRYFFKITKPKL